ncbi:MAG: hypothetical protein ACREGD_00045 [Candidatus Saccharimonadales bacterium]
MQVMATNYISSEIVKNDKTLLFFAACLRSSYVSKHIEAVVAEAFEKLSPYMKKETQVLHIKDVPDMLDNDQPLIYFDGAQTQPSLFRHG